MTDTSVLDAAMDQASAAADANPGGALADVSQGGAVAQTTGGALARPSLDDMADNAGIRVDAYINFKYEGMKIGKGKFFDKFTAVLDLKEATPITQVRANRGGQTTFVKSYDGMTTSTGENFQQKIAQLSAVNDKVDGPYSTVELPFLLESKVDGADVGQRVGITPPMTGTDEWNALYKELREKGLNQSKVRVEVYHIPRENRNGNEWGICGYRFIEEATD